MINCVWEISIEAITLLYCYTFLQISVARTTTYHASCIGTRYAICFGPTDANASITISTLCRCFNAILGK